MSPRTLARLAVSLLLVCAPLHAARSESALRLPLPEKLGEIPAVTYDEGGQAVGSAHLDVERLENGNIWLEGETGIKGGGETMVSAELTPVDGGKALQLVAQFSRSQGPNGESLGLLHIDHRERRARCFPPPENGKSQKPEELELPSPDYVANVPLNLLFLPLVKGEAKRISFQILLCRGGPRFVNARATVVHRGGEGKDADSGLVEIEYELDLPALLAAVARPFLPQISFWFDSKSPGAWVGHRMPLYSKGPTVLVVRSGVAPSALGIGP